VAAARRASGEACIEYEQALDSNQLGGSRAAHRHHQQYRHCQGYQQHRRRPHQILGALRSAVVAVPAACAINEKEYDNNIQKYLKSKTKIIPDE